MMLKTLISGLALTAALNVALPAFAQVTDQTDQSEEDWRKSRKKSGTSDIYNTPNTSPIGSSAPSIDYEPISPVERLPSESRRHLMKERAKAIAESDDGDISDAEYVPSEAAKDDEQLKRDEQEAWDVIVTDMSGSGGDATSDGGPNKVAVASEEGATSPRGARGGSTRTLQEIMDAIKSGQTGGGGPPSGRVGTLPGQSEQSGDPQSQAQGQGQAEGQDQAEAQGESGSAEQAASATDSGDGSDEGDQGDQSDQSGAGDQGDDAQASGAEAWPAETRAEEPLSPLERIRRAREEQPARGAQRSASDYLGTASSTPSEDD
jgi:hypothetical protein